jgi:hypothetical protein
MEKCKQFWQDGWQNKTQTGINRKQKLVPLCDKRVISGGDYVKKLWDRSTDNSEMFLLEVLIKN